MCLGNGFRGTNSSAKTSVQKNREILRKDNIIQTPMIGVHISLVRLLNIVRRKKVLMADKV